jgi:hypothetical protein
MEEPFVDFWQICWFFQMEPDFQHALIGHTEEQWFIEEDDSNKGANYLVGICLAFIECRPPDREKVSTVCKGTGNM